MKQPLLLQHWQLPGRKLFSEQIAWSTRSKCQIWTSVTGTNIVMRANQSKLNKSKNRAVVTFGKRSSMGTTTPRLTRPAIRVVIIHPQFNGCKNLTIAKLTIFNGLNRRGLHFHCLHPFRSNGCLGNPSL